MQLVFTHLNEVMPRETKQLVVVSKSTVGRKKAREINPNQAFELILLIVRVFKLGGK